MKSILFEALPVACSQFHSSREPKASVSTWLLEELVAKTRNSVIIEPCTRSDSALCGKLASH